MAAIERRGRSAAFLSAAVHDTLLHVWTIAQFDFSELQTIDPPRGSSHD
jgi:hypothetical protein